MTRPESWGITLTSENHPKAAIFVVDPGDIQATARCLDHCTSRGYHVVGIVTKTWDAAATMLRTGTAGIIVVDSHADLPADATPRCEVVADQGPVRAAYSVPAQRRTRVIRPGAAT